MGGTGVEGLDLLSIGLLWEVSEIEALAVEACGVDWLAGAGLAGAGGLTTSTLDVGVLVLDTEGLLAEGWVGSDGLVGFSSGAELDVGEAASAGALEVGNGTERGENGLDGVVLGLLLETTDEDAGGILWLDLSWGSWGSGLDGSLGLAWSTWLLLSSWLGLLWSSWSSSGGLAGWLGSAWGTTDTTAGTAEGLDAELVTLVVGSIELLSLDCGFSSLEVDTADTALVQTNKLDRTKLLELWSDLLGSGTLTEASDEESDWVGSRGAWSTWGTWGSIGGSSGGWGGGSGSSGSSVGGSTTTTTTTTASTSASWAFTAAHVGSIRWGSLISHRGMRG